MGIRDRSNGSSPLRRSPGQGSICPIGVGPSVHRRAIASGPFQRLFERLGGKSSLHFRSGAPDLQGKSGRRRNGLRRRLPCIPLGPKGGAAEGFSPRPPHVPKARRALTRSWTARANWLCVPSSWPRRTSTKAWMAVFQGTVFMTGPPWRKRPPEAADASGPDGFVSCHDSRRRGQAHTAGHTQAPRRPWSFFPRTIGRRNLVARSPPLRTLEEPAPIDSSSRSMKPVIRLGQVPGDGFPASGHDGSGGCFATPTASTSPPPFDRPTPF